MTDLAASAREIIDGSLYMVLGTADEADVQEPAPYRLYRASATQYWMLDKAAKPGDRRTPVDL